MPRRKTAYRALLWVALLACSTTLAATIPWLPSQSQAVEAARNSGKLVLLLAGRESCGNCQYMKDTVCESAPIRQILTENYVCWFSPVDTAPDWRVHASGLGGFTLPLICVIEPGDPTNHLGRSTAIQLAPEFQGRLRSHLPALPIRLTSPSRAVKHPVLAWSTESGLRYRVLVSGNLTHWDFVGPTLVGDGAAMEFQASHGASGFFRVMGFR